MAAALQKRCDGAAGAIAETTVLAGSGAQRLLLVSIGEGGEHDLERGGAALTARLQTSGVQTVHVDFASAGQRAAEDVLSFAIGAKLRNWRITTHRTRLTDTARTSLTTVVLDSPTVALSPPWGRYSHG